MKHILELFYGPLNNIRRKFLLELSQKIFKKIEDIKIDKNNNNNDQEFHFIHIMSNDHYKLFTIMTAQLEQRLAQKYNSCLYRNLTKNLFVIFYYKKSSNTNIFNNIEFLRNKLKNEFELGINKDFYEDYDKDLCDNFINKIIEYNFKDYISEQNSILKNNETVQEIQETSNIVNFFL